MQLTLAIHPITEIRFGSATQLEGTALETNVDKLRRLLLEDTAVTDVDFEIIRAGESCRAGPVFDIIEPRAKAPGSSPDFPGILGAPQTAGSGTTHVLEGAAVTILKERSSGDSRSAIGYLLEMSGAPAEGTKYSSLHHLIVMPRTKAAIPEHARQRAYRLAGLKAAIYLAQTAFDHPAPSTQILDIDDSYREE